MHSFSNDLVDRLKHISVDQMVERGIVSRAKVGYICPFCRDGSGKDGTGMSTKSLEHGTSWFCGKCNVAYDNIHLLAAYFGKDYRRDFHEVISLAADLFNLQSDNHPAQDTHSATATFIPDKYKSFITNANNNLKKFVDAQGGSWRGLSFDTLNKFFCGFNPNCIGMKDEPPLPHVIIPTSFNQYLARLVGKPDDYSAANGFKINPKPHHGQKEIFGFKLAINDDPFIFVTEGEIDAMSIWQATGYNVISVCGSALASNMRDPLKSIPTKNFIVLFDNDKTGIEKRTLLVNALQFLGHNAIAADLSHNFKDANDFLCAEPDNFKARLEEIFSCAKTDFYLAEKNCAANSAFDEQIAKWQAVNGIIDPNLLPKIKDAAQFVLSLSPFNFSASLAFDVEIRNNVALLNFYLPAVADKFFDILKAARDFSKAALHLIKKESGGNDVSGFSQLKKLAALAPSKILAEIDSIAADIKKQHKSFLRDYHAKIAGEKIKARLEEEKKQRESETTATNAKGCPITLRIPYDCYFNDRGISLIDFSGKFPKTIPVTKNPIVPTKILREPNSHSVQYEVAVKTGNVWRNVIVDGRVLFDPRQILVLADKGAWIEDPKSLAKFFARIIAENDSTIPEIKFYSQPGWKGNDFKFFAYPSGSDDYFVHRAGFDYPQLFASRGNPDLWLKKLNEVVNYGEAVAKVFLGNALLAPLIRPLNLQNAQIHIEAPNNSGKSALLKFAASIYGNPLELLKTFAASPKNRLSVAAACNDLPSFFDELETLGGKQAESTLSSMIYEFAEGVANQANKRDGSAREPVKFKGTRLSTAERPILKSHDQRGAYKRLVQLKIHFFFPDAFGSELHFSAENNFGHFGKPWTLFITEHLQDIQRSFFDFIRNFPKDGFNDWHGNFRNVEPTHLKSVVGSLLAFQFFLISCDIQAAIKPDSLLSDVIEILSMLPTPDELDDSTRALADLQSFAAAHDKFFEHENKDHSADGFTEYRQPAWECFGKKFDNGEVAFFPTALKKILEKELGYASADSLISAFAFKNLLRCSQGKGYRFSTRINGVAVNTIRFKSGVLLNNVDDEKEYEEELSEKYPPPYK